MSRKRVNSDKVVLLSDKPPDFRSWLKDRALEATAEGITISDNLQEDNPIVYANEGFERLTGYTKKYVLGRNCRFLQGEKTDPKIIEEIRRSIREEKPCSVEILNYKKDGTPFWNLLSITPIIDDSGRVTNFLGIQSDITKRKNYEKELYRMAAKLEASNNRMKKDFRDAKELQLSMLPSSLPKLPFLQVAVSTQTAQEVGGDYYDFNLVDNKLTFTIGDATGHGLKAGTIVTATKVLFNSFSKIHDPKEILNKISFSLKEMGFRNMYMAMLLAKISKEKMTISSAGIPFTYFYRKTEKTVKEIKLKGMPLGSFPGFNYKSKTINLVKGDTFLFHSDGLSECFNNQNKVFGESRIKSLFERIAHQTPALIINKLNEAVAQWRGSRELLDDMTMVVMKIK
jgi:PAS domain S-box-containing protein